MTSGAGKLVFGAVLLTMALILVGYAVGDLTAAGTNARALFTPLVVIAACAVALLAYYLAAFRPGITAFGGFRILMGGVVAGSAKIVEWLHQRGRPFLFSSAMTVPDVAACLAAVDILEESTELVDRLWANAKFFKAELKNMGFDTGKSVTPITPVMLGEAKLAQEFSRALYEEGIFGMAIGFPTVPRGTARIRVMISAAHSTDDLERGLEAFATVGKKLGVISY